MKEQRSADWKKMYLTLVSGILEASACLPVTMENSPAQERLNRALQEAEELYMESGEEVP